MDLIVLRHDNDFKITVPTKGYQYDSEVCRGTYEDCNFYLNCLLLRYPMTGLFNFEINRWYFRF